jgi:hypothetical protein
MTQTAPIVSLNRVAYAPEPWNLARSDAVSRAQAATLRPMRTEYALHVAP